MKRTFDLFAAIIGLIILSPLFVIIEILILLTMPGPVFYRQERIGRKGNPFYLYKFRSMRSLKDTQKGSFHPGDYSRITPLGRILRKTKIDELPQLINVIKGEMSIVGPRPEVEQWTKVYPDKWKIVHRLKPGITDNASIIFRNEEKILAASDNPTETYKNIILPQKLDFYIQYVNNNSLWGDILLIFKTMKIVILK